MNIGRSISVIVAPDEGNSISFRMSIGRFWVIVVGVCFGWVFFVGAIFFFIFGAKVFFDQRALVTENQRLRFALAKMDSIRIELERVHSMRAFIEKALVTVSQQTEDRRITRRTRERSGDSAQAIISSMSGIPEVDDYFRKIAEDEKFVPGGLPIKGMISATFGTVSGVFEKPHTGIDIAVAEGTPVHATASGVVCAVAKDEVYGNFIIVDHLNGYRTLYAHLQSSIVNMGDIVDRGMVIGFSGKTGRSKGPHLHYELSFNGNVVNPMEWEANGAE